MITFLFFFCQGRGDEPVFLPIYDRTFYYIFLFADVLDSITQFVIYSLM